MPKGIDLTGKGAIVTGGGAGIGRAIALSLAEAGADVAIIEIDPSRAEEAASRVEALGRRAFPIIADVMDSSALRDAIGEGDRHLASIDILVNNAGGTSSRPFLTQSEKNWRRLIDINFMSMLVATSAVVPAMIRGARGGVIINVATSEAVRAAPNYAVYAACKAAMVSFTQTMALELAEHRIRVNAIAPDHSLTPGMLGILKGSGDPATLPPREPAQLDALSRLVPLGREGLAEECGDAALFLASPLSSYVTGSLLPVDGGTMAAAGWVRSADRNWMLIDGL
jgi:NAD(P)-dependent dehydrogenase (short-subunit alcohol dehydrogenase family)